MKVDRCFCIWWILFLFAFSDSSADDTSAEMNHSSDLKWAMIGGAVGFAIGVSISIASGWTYYTLCYKSRQTRHQDNESNGDQSEPLLTTRSPAERENRQTATTTGENIKQQSETEQLENKPKTLLSELKEEKQELENQKDRNSELQKDNKQLHDTLDKVRTELENQKDQLLQKLRDVETKRKENKEEVQMVVDKITEKETSDDKDLLLGGKEKLLKSQWKLDEEKKLYERQILSIEKVMEPIEMNMMRTMEKNKDVKKTAEDGEGV